MKKFYFVLALFVFSLKLSADGGIWEYYLNIGGTWYGNQGANTNLNGAVLATNLNLNTNQLNISGSSQSRGMNTYQNSGCNFTSATFSYRVYLQGQSAPLFTNETLTLQSTAGNGDKFWSVNSPVINLLSGLSQAGTYNFEVQFSGTTNSSGGCNANISGYNYTATFTVTTPLPVKYQNFDVSRKPSVNYLQWSTATEINNDYFEVQHSNDGSNFTDVGFVKGHGNSNTERNYSFEHAVSSGKVFYYRLKQVDFDGRYEYSGIVSVKSDGKRSEESIIIAPNPVTDVANVFGLEEDATYRITDFAGKQYLSGMIIPGQTLDVADLKPGFYIVTIQNGAATSSSKMVKK